MGVVHRDKQEFLLLSSFGILGTAYCVAIQHLIDTDAIPDYESIIIEEDE